METFDDLGIPFPLFRGPVAHASVDSAGPCEICGATTTIRFCNACYACFRSGKVDNTVDTALGMVRLEDARNGLTHGIPMNDPSRFGDYELVPHPVDPNFPDETWYSFRIDSKHLLELVRTPTYHTWQGEYWQFCCKQPCVFLGSLPAGALPDEHPAIEAIANWIKTANWDAIANRPDWVHMESNPTPHLIDGCLRPHQLAKRLQIKPHWIYDRIRNGTIQIAKDTTHKAYLFPDEPNTIDQFKQLIRGEVKTLAF